MQLHAVIDQSVRPYPPEPLIAIAYAAVLVGLTFLTMRRPVYGVAALIAVQPFGLYSDVFHTTITLSKVVLCAVLLGLLGHSKSFASLRERVAIRFVLAGVLLIAATALSIMQAQYVLPALRETFKAAEYIAMFVAVYAAYRIEPNRKVICKTVTAIGILIALIAVSEEIIGAPSGMLLNNHVVPRVAGPLEGPNQLAAYLDISLPLMLAFAIGASDALLIGAISLGVFADVLTFSRGGAVGAIAGTITVMLIYRRNLREPLVAVLAGVGSGIAVAAAWGLGAHSFDLYRPGSLSTAGYAGGVGSRSELWKAALHLWLRRPWLGIGAGNYELELPQAGLRGIRTHANSLYVQALVEGGLPLLAATLWLTWTSIATFVRDRAQSPLIAGALAASIALAVHQVADFLTFYPKVGGWWWIVLALGAAEFARVNALKNETACA